MKLARFLVDHVVTVFVMVTVIVIFGAISYISLPRESAPDVKIPVVIVVTPYPGVSPEDVETLVSIPLERKLNEIKDVTKLRSISSEGVSTVTMEFDPDINIEDALQKVREKVDAAETDLPSDTEDTLIQEISFSDFPILIVTLTGPQDEESLKEIGEDLEEDIESITGVLDVKVAGGLTREIRVFADPDRLSLYNIAFRDIMGAIQGENVNIPGGTVDAGSANFMLRVPGEFTSVREIEDVPVKNVGGETIFLRDLARVVDGYAERATYSRLNGQASISLSVQKRVGENIIDIVQGVSATVEKRSAEWPEGTEFTLLSDQSRQIEDMVAELENNIISGLLLVVMVVLFFMGFRNSLFVALAIPLSMLVSFVVIQMMGLTLNFVVLFSLILALGMLVDNAIVIVENIYRHVEEGYDLKEASVLGVSEVAMPVATSTLTTVLAFAPMLFWSGVMGQFMGYLPKTLIVVLTSSLFVALVIIPAATSLMMKKTKGVSIVEEEQKALPTTGIMGFYRKTLEFSIDHRYLSVMIGVLSLIATFFAYGVLNHGTEFVPETEPDTAIITLTAPDGTKLDQTDSMARRIEAMLEQVPDVDTYVTEVGVSGNQFSTSSSPNSARITVNFLPSKDKARPHETPRSGSTVDAVDIIRESVVQIPGATISVEKIQEGPPVGAPIGVEIAGDDFYQLGEIASDVRRKMAGLPGVVDIDDDFASGRPELSFTVDRAAAKKIGASTSSIASTVRTAVAGTKASVLREGDEEYDIIVEMDPAYKENLQSILDLRIPGRDNITVPLATVASVEPRGGAGAVRRLDVERVVTISANIGEGYNQNEVRQSVVALLDSYPAPEGVNLRLGGANDEQAKAAAFLGKAFLAAISMIFLVLVTQFNSATVPFIIMASVILSLIGVLWGLIITGKPFGILMTGIGVISLAGVVVNNAIVLIDYVEQLKRQGLAVRDALVRAGLVRFRPVILTAITTVLGLLPMATGVSIDFTKFRIVVGGSSQAFWGSMAIAVIFGLAVATVLTLVMVPTMYSINDQLSSFIQRLRNRGKNEASGDELDAETPDSPDTPTPTPPMGGVVGAGLLLLLALPNPVAAEVITLEAAIAAAESNNIDLRIREEQTFQAETYVGQGWSLLGPRVSGSGSYTVNQFEATFPTCNYLVVGDDPVMFDGEPVALCSDPDGGEIVFAGKTAFEWNATVSQPIFNGQALPALRAAYGQRDAARLDENNTRMQIHAGIVKAYYGLVIAHEAERLSAISLENSESRLELVTRQVQAGSAAPLAELQAQLAVSRAQREQVQALQSRISAAEAFAVLTGLSADVEVEMPAGMDLPVENLADALNTAIEKRPDLNAAHARARASKYQARANYASWLPTVDGRFTYRWSENTGFVGEKGQWTAAVVASWVPWDGGARVAGNRRAASEARMAELFAQKTAQQAQQEVKVAWEKYQRAEEVYQVVKKEVELAEETMRLAEESLNAGAISYFEAQDTQLALDAARLNLLTERMNRDLVTVELAVAIGLFRQG